MIREVCSSPDPDRDFLPIPDPGVKKALDPGSGSASLTLNDPDLSEIGFGRDRCCIRVTASW
jgi:hypothetical protein